MSNRVTFQNTKFVNLNEVGKEIDASYGYRIYDDYEQVYNNCLEKATMPNTPEEALKIIMEHEGLDDAVLEHGGFFFNDTYYRVDSEGKILKEKEA